MNPLADRLAFATDLTRSAGAMALRLRPPPGAAQAVLKGRQDWLTQADEAVEQYISERLQARFPEDGFQGEEAGRTRAGRLRWVVDPIDGTSNFARGGTRWCVSVALMEQDVALLGVLSAPARQELYAAGHGTGATLNGAPIQAAVTTDMNRAMVEAGWSPRVDSAAYLALCGRIIGAGAALRSGGSGALGLVEVAVGRLDGYVELHINVWDCAGALAVLAEAGAVTNAYRVAGGPILAAAPGIGPALAGLAGLLLKA